MRYTREWMTFITTWWVTDCMVTRLLRAKVLAWVLLLSWGFFLDPKGALLQWEILIHHIILGLSSFIPVGFFGFFFFSPSAYVPMGFFGFFFFGLNAYIPGFITSDGSKPYKPWRTLDTDNNNN